jgi:hypothetical protein
MVRAPTLQVTRSGKGTQKRAVGPTSGSTLMVMATARLGSIALDCASSAELATFWSELLGGEIAFTSETFVAIKTDRVWLDPACHPFCLSTQIPE